MEIIKYLDGDIEILLSWSTKAGQNIFNTLWIETSVGLAAVSQPDAASVVQEDHACALWGQDGCTASRELGPSKKPEGKERGWKSSSALAGELWVRRISAVTAGRVMPSAPSCRERHSQPCILGYQHNLPALSPRFPGTVFFPTCLLLFLQLEEFLLSISGPTLSPVAHKIIKTSPKLEQPLTLPSRSPLFRLTNQLCIINL